jgi:YesN/AraC family two-component response regulator
MKPVVFYVDDEPRNLALMETIFPDDWKLFTYEMPGDALANIQELKPWVVLSDQRMPSMDGAQFLEIVRSMVPDAVRIIVTGQSSEAQLINSIRKAQIADFVSKPFDADTIEFTIKKAIDMYLNVFHSKEAQRLAIEAKTKQEQVSQELEKAKNALEHQCAILEARSLQLDESRRREVEVRKELESWLPPAVTRCVIDERIQFPLKRDLFAVCFDVINSSSIHDLTVDEVALHKVIIEKFTQAVLLEGGLRENHFGDSSYAHFGAFDDLANPAERAFSAARQFRTFLRTISDNTGVKFECGIALHKALNCQLDILVAEALTKSGRVIQKSFGTTGPGIDLLHRIEKLTHQLPGSNILITKEFFDELKNPDPGLQYVGKCLPKGAKEPVSLYLYKSSLVSNEDLDEFKRTLKEQFLKSLEGIELAKIASEDSELKLAS